MINISKIRSQFPILAEHVHGKPLIYLDNAATTQKPLRVLDCSRQYYESINSNIHRGIHHLSQLATEAHEQARETLAAFVGATSPEEFVFTSGCTMGLNMIASILGRVGFLAPGDEIILSISEHHSNIVPWQMLCERTGAIIKVIPLDAEQTWDMEQFSQLLSPKTKIVSLAYVANGTGTINPIRQAISQAKAQHKNIITIVDAAQAVGHLPVNVQQLGCDFLVFSGHKIYAPTGIGGLWGKKELLDYLPPWMGGGEMISEVTFEKTTYNALPFKYEAGTPNIEGAIAMAEAVRFINSIGLREIELHEKTLVRHAIDRLHELPLVHIPGRDDCHGAAISLIVQGVHHYDLGALLDQMGIAVRTGHHCCQPLMAALGVTGTTRLSFAVYNTLDEVDQTVGAIQKAISMLV